mgnify:CR=1 FL=1
MIPKTKNPVIYSPAGPPKSMLIEENTPEK